MDYEALAQLVPLPPTLWNHQHITEWLNFIHLPALASSFRTSTFTQNSIVFKDQLSSPSANTNLLNWELAAL